MVKNFFDFLNRLPLRSGPTAWTGQFLLASAILIPILLTGALNYTTSYVNLTQAAMARREATAFLAATTLKEHFNRLNDVAQLALANRVEFYRLLKDFKWKEAAYLFHNLPQDLPFVDRILLADLNGVLAGEKERVAELYKSDVGFRPWYETLAREGRPYISDIYQTNGTSPRRVVAVAVPIRPSAKELSGVLILEVRVETLFKWAYEIDVGPSGFLYFVDRQGRVAAHPRYPQPDELPDFSAVPEVRKVLHGEAGVGVFLNPVEHEKQVVAYEPVPGFGWGAVAGQPAKEAFAVRDRLTRLILLIYGFILILGVSLTAFILYAFDVRRRSETALRKAHDELEIKVRERTRELTSTQASLKEAVRKLKNSNEELEQFAFVASHDLQAPLHKIIMFGDLLEESAQTSDEKKHDYLDRMRSAAKRMQELIVKLLELARVTTQAQPFEPVPLEGVLREVLSDFEARILELGAGVDIQGEWPTVTADKVQMRQLFGNLVSNGLKYQKKGSSPRVVVRGRVAEDRVEIEVEDNGIGFDEAQRERIFEPFKRLHTSEEYEGSGIGLATCQKIALRHGGSITARSTLGKGSVFTVTLPLEGPSVP